MIRLKNKQQIKIMQESSKVVADVLTFMSTIVKPSISTLDLELEGLKFLSRHYPEARPAFKGYMGFPRAFCISINEEVVHGIPNKEKKIEEGDIVSIDFGIELNGYYGDSAISVIAGNDIKNRRPLLDATENALNEGIKKAVIGNTLADIGKAIEDYVVQRGYSVVRDFVGHGIGKVLHEEPQVPNFYTEYAKKIKLKEGMTIAIEPMVNYGTYEVKVLSDGWTVVTKDNLPSAHFEHTIAITKSEPIIMTRRV